MKRYFQLEGFERFENDGLIVKNDNGVFTVRFKDNAEGKRLKKIYSKLCEEKK